MRHLEQQRSTAMVNLETTLEGLGNPALRLVAVQKEVLSQLFEIRDVLIDIRNKTGDVPDKKEKETNGKPKGKLGSNLSPRAAGASDRAPFRHYRNKVKS